MAQGQNGITKSLLICQLEFCDSQRLAIFSTSACFCAEADADCFYAPGITTRQQIAAVAAAAPKPSICWWNQVAD